MYKALVGAESDRFAIVYNTADFGIGVLFSKSYSGVVFEIAFIYLHLYILGWNKNK